MEKLFKDGKVAVAVSGGYGAGWSTWNDVDPMDARFNKLIEQGKFEEVIALCEELDLGYAGGVDGLGLEWLPEGTEFIIEEYDGSESITIKDNNDWRIA